MRHPYDEAGTWVANLGPGYTGLGSGGTNTVQWSIRTTADAAVGGYDWATGVLELAGGEGQYLVLFPANVVGAAGRYVIRARTASGGKHVSEELIFGPPQYVGADTSGTTTLLSRLTSTRAGLLDNLDAAISSRSTYAGADTAGTTTLLARLTSGRATNLDNLDAAVSGVAAAVWASGTRTLSSFGTLVADVWANSTRSLTDKAGFALSTAGVQAIWDALVASLTTANSIGKRIVDNLDAASSSRASQTSVDALGSPLQAGDYTAPPSASTIAAAVWDRLTSALTTVGSIGKLVTDRLDVILSTRLAASGYTAPDNTGIAAVKAKTDNLPTDPADESILEAAIAALGSPAQTSDARLAHLDADVSSRSTLTAAQVWAASGRTLTSFGTLAADAAAAVWAAVTRTLTSAAAPSAAANASAVWEEILSGHTTAGSAGAQLAAVGSPWEAVAASHDTPGTMGELLNDAGGWVDPLQNPIQIGKASPITFNFGPAHSGLATVGFQLYNADGTPFGPRHTENVVELGHGSYQATYTWNAEWLGSVIGDTGTIAPTYTPAASIVVQAPAHADVDFSGVEGRLAEIEEDVDQIPVLRAPG